MSVLENCPKSETKSVPHTAKPLITLYLSWRYLLGAGHKVSSKVSSLSPKNGDLGSSFNHLSDVYCYFLVKTVLSASSNLKPATAALQWRKKGETFTLLLEKQLTALLPREAQHPSYKCFSSICFLGMRHLTTPLPIQSIVFIVLLHCRLKLRCLLASVNC